MNELVSHSGASGCTKVDVMVVDDDIVTRKIVRGFLKSEALSFVECGDGNEALKLLESHSPRLLVIDLHMPELDGDQLMVAISERKMMDHFSVMMITADEVSEDSEFYMGTLGIEQVMAKPLEAARFKAELRKYLKRADVVQNELG